MRNILLLLPAALILIAASANRSYRSLMEEPAPSSLPIPVAGVRASQLSDSWGDPRSEGRSHEGIDIMARRGTPVVSATHGIVSAVQWRDRGGNTVSVHGPAGYRHYYAHLDSYGAYEEGDWVEVGDTLGFVGSTGNAQGTAPHLHYGIYTPEGAINPYPLLKGQKSAAGTNNTSSTKRTPSETTGGATKGSKTKESTTTTSSKGVRSRRSTAVGSAETSAPKTSSSSNGAVARRRR